MFTSDSHEGIKYAISHIFPDTPWQRCQFHFRRNIIDKMPKKYQEVIASELNEMFNCDTVESARKKRDLIISQYSDIAESAMSCLDEGFEDSMTVMVLPKEIRQYFRTSNPIERLNAELKRRSKVIGIFPNVTSLERLMGSVLLERNDTQSERPVFYSTAYQKVEASVEKLRAKAKEQQQMLLAS
jgi:transposase-like protein